MTGMDDLDALIARADQGLYAAKHSGRDRCCFDAEPLTRKVSLAISEGAVAPEQAVVAPRAVRGRSRQRSARSFRHIRERVRASTYRLDV